MAPISLPVRNNQLLPTIVENRASSNPQGVWGKIPNSETTYASGIRPITNLDFANAVNKVAWLLEKQLGRSSNFETLAYVGPNDVRYFIIVVAAVKVGYKAFFPSPRNSKTAQISLLSGLQCKIMLTPETELPAVPAILEDYNMRKLCIPTLKQLLDPTDVPANYPYERSFDEAKDDPIFVLHTSGSTGIPKPLTFTHNYGTRIANSTSLAPPKGFFNLDRNFCKGTFFSMLPPFHIAGLAFPLIVPAFNDDCVPVFPLPGKPPTIDGFLEVLKYTSLDWALLPPVMIDQLGMDPAALESVANGVDYLYFTGGSVPKFSGDVVASRLPLYQVLDSSECGAAPLLRSEHDHDDLDWEYMQIHHAAKAEFRHRFDDFYELVFVKTPESELYHPVFTHFPDIAEYETRDLYSPHPTKSGLWRHRGRIDDVIVFLNGEKTNPVSFETEVSKHPDVRSALVAGQKRLEASLLIELAGDKPDSPEEKAEIIERIWPVVQKANTQCPAHAKVSKSKILLADPSMPMVRAGKGTVMRQATLNLYSKMLNDLYAETNTNGVNGVNGAVPHLDISDQSSVADTVRGLVKAVTEWAQLDDEEDFFSRGMDSLQVLQLVRELKMHSGPEFITGSTIYRKPSVKLLTEAIMKYARGDQSPIGSVEEARLDAMAWIYRKYVEKIDQLKPFTPEKTSKTRKPSPYRVVALTGSTGAVGSYILHNLLQDETVGHVYCLNRAFDSKKLQTSRNTQRSLPTEFPKNRVTFLTAELSQPDLGLGPTVYETIFSKVTTIIHNAWPVDFNRTLQSFHAHFDGIFNLVSFAATSPRAPPIFFLSSISTISNYHNTANADTRVPEAIVEDMSSAAAMGYGESKYVAERILDYATRKLPITTGVVRIGQIAGTAQNPRGWNKNEWLPTLVLSSKHMGALPESLGAHEKDLALGGMMENIDWVPIDQLAVILIELAFGLSKDEYRIISSPVVYHPVNPYPTTWKKLLPTVKQVLEGTHLTGTNNANINEIQTIPFNEWLDHLRKQSSTVTNRASSSVAARTLRRNPGVKLLGFYESLLEKGKSSNVRKMENKRALQSSQSLRNLEAIRPEWMAGWVKEWVGSM